MTDTGGHYLEGSTDITRTVALGEVGNLEKEHFTLVARAMLRLANTVFLYGCSGANLISLAIQSRFAPLYFSTDAVVRIWIVLQERSFGKKG